ncbi:MAG: AAA family ATPase [Bacteroidales bacterium]|jgi:predicted AAA+ superfamily ATPase|nr:AAA family ATPase [Bacteroidales bacterium]
MVNEKYFHRTIDKELLLWSNDKNRRVLLLRGARQVGKSSAVRNLGKHFKYFVEINFEDVSTQIKNLFIPGVSPQEICQKLSVLKQTPIIPGETLLFLDEIQGCIPAISKLRFFYEQYHELHVVAAGSLLEFALEALPSFGVGRISSYFMYPFSFREFLIAQEKNSWVEEYSRATPDKPLFEALHEQLIRQLQIFMSIGGMPAVISEYIENQDLLRCQGLLNDILVSFRNDFAKYRDRIPASRINEVFESVAKQAQGKFVYEKAGVQLSNRQVKDTLELLIKAGLVYPVTHTAANGIPLGAEANHKFERMFMFDTGLFQHILGLNVGELLLAADFKTVNRGALAEIFVGLELIKASSCNNPHSLYYWQREKKRGSAQVDFLVQKNDRIIPLEVKSGTQGAMQSLRWFMQEKKIDIGVRTSLENFARYDNIEVYPLYAISNLLKDKRVI